MSIPNNTNNKNQPTTVSSSSSTPTANPSSVGGAFYYLSQLATILLKVKQDNNKLTLTSLKQEFKQAKATAEASVKEAVQDAQAARINGIGDITSGVISGLGAGFTLKQTPEMKAMQNQVDKAKTWLAEPSSQSNDQAGSIEERSRDIEMQDLSSNKLNSKFSDEKVNIPSDNKQNENLQKNDSLNRNKEQNNVNVKKNQQKANDDQVSTKNEDLINMLKSDKARDNDVFSNSLTDPVSATDSDTWEEVLSDASDADREEIKSNINKYIKDKTEKIDAIANGGTKRAQMALFEALGTGVRGIFQMCGASIQQAKTKYIRERVLAQNGMDMMKTILNQYIQQNNSFFQSLMTMFSQTLTALCNVGIMPS